MLGVRPEDVEVAPAATAGWEEAQALVVEPMGSETFLTIDYRNQRLVARVPADCDVQPGQRVGIRLPPDRVVMFDASDGKRYGVEGQSASKSLRAAHVAQPF